MQANEGESFIDWKKPLYSQGFSYFNKNWSQVKIPIKQGSSERVGPSFIKLSNRKYCSAIFNAYQNFAEDQPNPIYTKHVLPGNLYLLRKNILC